MRFPLNPSGREGTGFGSTYLNPRSISSTSCILVRVTTHYAIKRPPNQASKGYCNVTEGTC